VTNYFLTLKLRIFLWCLYSLNAEIPTKTNPCTDIYLFVPPCPPPLLRSHHRLSSVHHLLQPSPVLPRPVVSRRAPFPRPLQGRAVRPHRRHLDRRRRNPPHQHRRAHRRRHLLERPQGRHEILLPLRQIQPRPYHDARKHREHSSQASTTLPSLSSTTTSTPLRPPSGFRLSPAPRSLLSIQFLCLNLDLLSRILAPEA